MSVLENTKEYSISRYKPSERAIWDEFVSSSSNGTFLFRRSFMDYHKDRFMDNSYLIWERNRLLALFVAGVANNAADPTILIAHPGLTYGGLVHKADTKYYEVEKAYSEVVRLAKEEGFKKIIIKPVSRAFCSEFSEAQNFYFFVNNFSIVSREVNSVIDLTKPVLITRARKKNLRKSESLGLSIRPSPDCSQFYSIMVESLSKTHGVSPVHTQVELQQLMADNPENIKHYVAVLNEAVVGGTILFIDRTRGFVHTQYTHANSVGRDARAIDALVMNTISEAQSVGITRLSFGISTVKGVLNPSLLSQKEDFGSLIELMDIYEYKL